jgi:hypothetical protein
VIGFNQSLTVITPTLSDEKDAYGNPTYSDPTTTSVLGFLHQKNSKELVNGQWQTVEGWVAYLPPGVVIDFTCVIQAEDENNVTRKYQVQAVSPHRTFTGAVDHLTCTLTKAGA